MAGSIFALLDDIAALMDDVAVAAKMATKKTAGILGDDLAVNAEKATGFLSNREIPVLWKITKGSILNKIIIIPIVFLLQWIYPPAIIAILIVGGFYLAYEGMEKIIHYFTHRKSEKSAVAEVEEQSKEEMELNEKTKVKSAILTDFILSIEIVIIALSNVLGEPMPVQILTVSVVAFIAVVGVYGIVALIVRMDDLGFRILKKSNNKGFGAVIGNGLVKGLPLVIRSLTVVGTIALILVAGGIFTHNIDYFHDLLPGLPAMLKDAIFGIVAGTLVVIVITPIKKLITKKK